MQEIPMPEPDPVSSPRFGTDSRPPCSTRRAVILGAGVAVGAGMLVAGCSTVETPGGTAASSDDPAGTPVGQVSDVPVGSGQIFDAVGVVVTQATAGNFAAFSTTCPHQGCAVSAVEGTSIVCPCHGSRFALDGNVTNGPATRGLDSLPIAVADGEITLA
jgi:Rieske Fe-S protein